MAVRKRAQTYFAAEGTPAPIRQLLTHHHRIRSRLVNADIITLGFSTSFEGQFLLHKYEKWNKSFILFPVDFPRGYVLPSLDGYELTNLTGALNPAWAGAIVLRPIEHEEDEIAEWKFPTPNNDSSWTPTSWIRVSDLERMPRRVQRSVSLDMEEAKMWKLATPDWAYLEGDADAPEGTPKRCHGLRLPQGLELLSLPENTALKIQLSGIPIRFIPMGYLHWFARSRALQPFPVTVHHEPEWVNEDQLHHFHHHNPIPLTSSHFSSLKKEERVEERNAYQQYRKAILRYTPTGAWVVHPNCKLRMGVDREGFPVPRPWIHEVEIIMRNRKENILLDVVKEYVKRSEFDEYERLVNTYYSDANWNSFFGTGFWTGLNVRPGRTVVDDLGDFIKTIGPVVFDNREGETVEHERWVEYFLSAGTSAPCRERNPEIRANRISRFDFDPAPSDWILGLTDDMRVSKWVNGADGQLTNFLFSQYVPLSPVRSENDAWRKLLEREAWLTRQIRAWADLRLRCITYCLPREEFLADLDEVNDHLLLIEREIEDGCFHLLTQEDAGWGPPPAIELKTKYAFELFGDPVQRHIVDAKKTLASEDKDVVVFQQRRDLVLHWIQNLIEQLRTALSQFGGSGIEDDEVEVDIERDYLKDWDLLLSIEKPEEDEEEGLDFSSDDEDEEQPQGVLDGEEQDEEGILDEEEVLI